MQLDPTLLHACAEIARAAGLELLLLFGSRGRGTAHPGSDWDFAAWLPNPLDVVDVSDRLAAAVGCDAVDLVDLQHAGGLVRFHAARDGVLLYESSPELFLNFRIQATTFWLDAQHVIETEYRRILDGLNTQKSSPKTK